MIGQDTKEETLRPSAARLMESMRDIGYSFESALADIVDTQHFGWSDEGRNRQRSDPVSEPHLAILMMAAGMSLG